MEEFNLDKWLQDKSRKVVTRDGREVDLYYSPTSRIPLIGATTSDNEIHQYTKDGFQCDTFNQAKNDLFFADEENELTEFEKAMIQFSHERNSLIQFEHTTEEINAHLYLYSEKLLDLARKELKKEFKDEEYFRLITEHYKQGKQDALKDLPKLEKTKDCIDPTIPIMYTNTPSMKSYVEYHGYKLCINDVFEKLPKEE